MVQPVVPDSPDQGLPASHKERTVSDEPEGWSFERDYYVDGSPAWWHDDCPTPKGDYGGIASEQRVKGALTAVLCIDCGASISVNHRPAATKGAE
jgi:hypothetical protein